MKKFCITGSNGFIASHLIEEAHKKGYKVVGISRHLGNILEGEKEVKPDILYLGDVRDKSLVEKAVSTCDGVINLAGILGTQETINNPYPSVETNIIGALNVFEAVKQYKIPCVQIAVGNWFENNSYSITKTTAERFGLMYAKEHGCKINIVRALNAFGERQKWYPVRKMMPTFITRALKNEPIEIYGDGQQIMDFVYVKDVANILLEALFKEEYGELYEAGTGLKITVKEWAEKVIKYSGSKSKIVYLPMRPGESIRTEVYAKNPYPYSYTNVDRALKKVIRWYRKNL